MTTLAPELKLEPNPRVKQDPGHPYIMTCTRSGCNTRLASRDIEHALWQWKTHMCPWLHNMTERIQEVKNSKRLFAIQFEALDTAINEFMIETELARKAELKGAIDAHAFHIRLWMQPIFADEKAVKREGMRRYKEKQAGEPTSTPGVDYDWRPGIAGGPSSHQPGSVSVPTAALPAQTRSVAAITTPGSMTGAWTDPSVREAVRRVTSADSVDETKHAQVLKMYQSGNFEPKIIAHLTGLTEQQVATITQGETA